MAVRAARQYSLVTTDNVENKKRSKYSVHNNMDLSALRGHRTVFLASFTLSVSK